MNTYKITLRYQGTGYFGWQIQPTHPTIQGELNQAFCKIFKSAEIRTIASGRTDAGVHALGQIVKVEVPHLIDSTSLLRALNNLLPAQIEILDIEVCEQDFQPVFHCKWKEYRYYFYRPEDRAYDAFMTGKIARSPQGLDLNLIAKGVKLFEGQHDFLNYFCVGTPVKSTVRTIFHGALNNKSYEFPWSERLENYHVITFRGNGFLKQMVRLLVGTLWKLGEGKISLKDIETSFNQKYPTKFGSVAPAEGLYLTRVSYQDYPLV